MPKKTFFSSPMQISYNVSTSFKNILLHWKEKKHSSLFIWSVGDEENSFRPLIILSPQHSGERRSAKGSGIIHLFLWRLPQFVQLNVVRLNVLEPGQYSRTSNDHHLGRVPYHNRVKNLFILALVQIRPPLPQEWSRVYRKNLFEYCPRQLWALLQYS